MPGADRASGRRPSGWPQWELLAFLELFALCGFVFAQPVLDVTSNSPEFFLFHRAGTGDILLMVAVFTLVPPLALWAAGALTGFAGRRTRAGAQLLVVSGLFAALAIQVGRSWSPLRGLTLGLVAAVAAAVLVVVYLQFRVARSVLRMAAVGPVVFALLFVFASPVSNVVLAGGEQGSASAATTKSGDHPPVVMIMLDEFPLVTMLGDGGRIDAERFPNFAELAGGSTWYRNSTAVARQTVNAAPAMLTGRYPAENVAPHYVEYPNNMFSLFSDVYEIYAHEGVTRLCEPWRCLDRSSGATGGLRNVLTDGTRLLTDIVSPDEPETEPLQAYREPTLADGEVPPDFLVRSGLGQNQPVRFHEFTQALAATDGDRPTMHFLHLLTPHRPWKYLASGNSYKSIPDLDFVESAPDKDGAWEQWWLQISQQRLAQQAAYTDLLIGETMRVMRERGIYDDALFVVTADHGISFSNGARGRQLDPKYRSAAELLWVPTFVKAPGQREGRIDDRNWEHVDVLPTVADHAGIEIPWPVDGRSGAGEPRRRTDKYFHPDGGATRRVLDGPKFFAEVLQRSVPRLPDPPMPELVGQPVDTLTVTDGGPPAEIRNLGNFSGVDRSSGEVPALVHGTVAGRVGEGTLLAVAVNGRIGAVLPVINRDGEQWFVGLITDDGLFTDGANHVELFSVAENGTELTRLGI